MCELLLNSLLSKQTFLLPACCYPGSDVPVCTRLQGRMGQHHVSWPGCCGCGSTGICIMAVEKQFFIRKKKSPPLICVLFLMSNFLIVLHQIPSLQPQPVTNNNPWMLLYFISFLLIVSFFVLNMFVGVVVENFHKCRQHQEVEEAKRREEKRQRRMEKKRRSKSEG